jgi:DNA-binding NarL/FixJ family response regulator
VNPLDLASVVRQTHEGTTFSAIAGEEGDEVAAARAEGLSDREIAILRALASGLSNQAIGRELWVSEQTIKFHLRNVYRKLGLSNRTEAARYAHEIGLVDEPL